MNKKILAYALLAASLSQGAFESPRGEVKGKGRQISESCLKDGQRFAGKKKRKSKKHKR